MKKYILIIISLFAFTSALKAQTGIWSGDLEVMGNKLPLVFHLDDENPSVDSPAQGAKGIPIEISRGEDNEIIISIPLIKASFQGKFEDNQINGTFQQNGFSLPLTLSPGEKKPERPQTPQPPFSYSEEEVSFSNGDAILKGTLTLPPGYNKATPVVLMVTGSGLQNRDEEIFDHKPFAVIADALAKENIASLRYDDRGFGESTGDPVNCTTEDLMRDALAGVNFLRNRFDNVGVLGHSEGGTIALMLGAENKVDFIVSLAGMVVSGKETLLEQNKIALSKAGFSQDIVNRYCELLLDIFDNYDETVKASVEVSALPQNLKTNLETVGLQMSSPYMKYFVNLDMRDKLNDITVPVLALNGTKDMQVNSKTNLEALKNGLNSEKRNKIIEIEGVNHLFQHCNTGDITEYANIEETFSPEVLAIINDWIQSL